jgi:hypothetical protein
MRKFAPLLTILLTTTTLNAADKTFWALAAGAQAATVFDAETTVRTLRRCATCVEGNPFMKPFVGTRPGAYFAGTALTTAGFYEPYKMRQRGSRWWWAPIVAQIGMHTALGIRNSRMH